DEIAYLTADLEDGLGAGILELQHVRAHVSLFADFYADAEREYPAAEPHLLTNESLKQMLNTLATDLVQEVSQQARNLGIQTLDNLRRAPHRIALLSPEVEEKRRQAKTYLYAHLYQSPELDAEHALAEEVVKTLYAAWTENPELLPLDHQARIREEGVPRAVADYIAGMTDAYIEQAWLKHKELNSK
ncbi:MAG TPA: deoxyguanosinetriphosphate triphosphohydrolase, partial [Acidobacteriaceae bacterium]|nr:deoxyguanosinetriphosphate triphosphohydrolase [Acidobacteriaceae bacterium]